MDGRLVGVAVARLACTDAQGTRAACTLGTRNRPGGDMMGTCGGSRVGEGENTAAGGRVAGGMVEGDRSGADRDAAVGTRAWRVAALQLNR